MSRALLKDHPQIRKYTTIWMDTVRNGTFGLSNTNKLVRFYNGATGLKTGFTSGAGYCLSASAMRDGMELVAVVMGAETSKSRNAACKQLLDFGFASYALVSPELSDIPDVPVKLGKTPCVAPQLGENSQLLIDKAMRGSITTEYHTEESLTAPVSKGQRMGTLTVKAGEQTLAEIPLVAADSVERLTWWELFIKVFRQLAMARPKA